eukprot:4001516-Pyramimonas_sp.AAC.1
MSSSPHSGYKLPRNRRVGSLQTTNIREACLARQRAGCCTDKCTDKTKKSYVESCQNWSKSLSIGNDES